MVAGRTSGGSIGGVGGAARGSSGIGSRGSGIESRGGPSGGRTFGNTARFESSFSGRSLATLTRPTHTESRRSSSFGPRLEAVKHLSPDTHRPSISPWSNTKSIYSREASRTQGTQRSEKTATRLFGPHIEAARNHSVDSHRPHVSAFRDMKPIYVSKTDAKYHAQPGHAKFHTEPRFPQRGKESPKVPARSFGPKLEVVKTPSSDTHRPHVSLQRETKPIFSRSEITPKVVERPQLTQTREQHPLQKTTRELNIHKEQPKRPSPPRFTYERKQSKLDPMKEYTRIAPTGERTVVRGKIDSAARWQRVMLDKQQKPLSPTVVKAEAGKKVQSEVHSKLAKKAAERARIKSPLLSGTEPLPINSQAQLEQRVIEDLKTPQWQVTRPETQAKPTTSVESVRQPQPRVVTHTETQKVLDRYVEHVRERRGISPSQSTEQLSVVAMAHHETRADIEQAARVMQMYKELWPEQAEKAVISALDQKLEKRGLPTEFLTKTQEEIIPTVSPLKQSEPEVQTQAVAIEQPSPSEILPALLPRTETEVITRTTPTVTTETKTEEAVASQTDTQLQLTTQTQQQSTVGIQQLTQPDAEQEDGEEEKEEQLQTPELHITTFERDETKDLMRISAAVFTGMYLQYTYRDKEIPGDVIAQSLVDFYDELTSTIVPDEFPDDYLTDIIEKIAERDYTSYQDVARYIQELVDIYPAIKIGEKNNITKDEAMKIFNSTKRPQVSTGRRTNNL